MLSEGFVLMGFGMGVVFVFLIVMVLIMYFTSYIVQLVNKIYPEKVEEVKQKTQKAVSGNNDDIAVVLAVVKSHIS